MPLETIPVCAGRTNALVCSIHELITELEERIKDGEPFERVSALLAEARPTVLTGDQLLAAQAMRLLMRLDSELLEARAQFNRDWFRRLMHARPKAVSRLRRRWGKINPRPRLPLGSLRRRYHANLARYLYQTTAK